MPKSSNEHCQWGTFENCPSRELLTSGPETITTASCGFWLSASQIQKPLKTCYVSQTTRTVRLLSNVVVAICVWSQAVEEERRRSWSTDRTVDTQAARRWQRHWHHVVRRRRVRDGDAARRPARFTHQLSTNDWKVSSLTTCSCVVYLRHDTCAYLVRPCLGVNPHDKA